MSKFDIKFAKEMAIMIIELGKQKKNPQIQSSGLISLGLILIESNSKNDLIKALECFQKADDIDKDYRPPKYIIKKIKEKLEQLKN